jgi:hypothetical protein
MQGKAIVPRCDWLAVKAGHDVGPGALRRVKELLRHVGKCGERYADGFVAPIVGCLYDDEGVLDCCRMRIAVAQQFTRATASRAGGAALLRPMYLFDRRQNIEESKLRMASARVAGSPAGTLRNSF